MALSPAEREELIRRYEAGPAMLRTAYDKVPAVARQWRPEPGAWSVHEIVIHCGDSETTSSSRIRFVLAEQVPLILGYDEAAWAVTLDYHRLPIEPAFAAVASTRANTAALLRTLPEEAWSRSGRHSATGPYGAEDWLRIYASHLEEHTQQIEANLAAWEASH